MRDTPALDPRDQRRGRADCGVRSRNRSCDHADRADHGDHANYGEADAA